METANQNRRVSTQHVVGIDVLRGVAAGFAQVFMHNNPLAGAVLLLAVAANSSQHAACALLGALIGTLGGKALGIPAQNIRHGVCSFNGALIGIVLARYLGYGAMTLFLVAVCSASSLIMSGFISKTFHQPHYSLPFVLLIWLALFSTSVPIPAAGEASGGELDPALAVINGIGQTLFQTGKVSGALVLLALAIAEPIAAAIALGISVTVMLAAMLFGVSTSAINSGVLACNPILVVLALRVAGRPVSAQLLGAIATVILDALIRTTAWPPLHAPFIGVVWLMHLRLRNFSWLKKRTAAKPS
jgi:urea transporter